jgi:hypothetical protein
MSSDFDSAPAKSSVPYFKWRSGHPRWEPGPGLRRRGWRGRDLKDVHGKWLPFDSARALAEKLNAEVRERQWNAQQPRATKKLAGAGFVYFLWAGDHVKIGWSKNPFNGRVADLKTSTPYEIRSVVAVPGTLYQEQKLHIALDAWRCNGEWFAASPQVLRAMNRSLSCGEPDVGLHCPLHFTGRQSS